jgi:lactoylglutathione lyase
MTIGTDGPADPATVGFNLNHLGIQVSNVTASREFYGDVLGLRHIFTFNASENFTIVYMGYAQGGRNKTGYQTGAELARDQWNSDGLLELLWSRVSFLIRVSTSPPFKPFPIAQISKILL